ncbi:hypothetical protein LSH36_1109g00039 [Paralvinella palmiformis]|uniref:15-cis-phytoene synthase n=1 Tax=Paralvinella palmiformis TaxID=53620 RepID=A0AAD9IVL1_9ANNE|nr:hypothetical protein LSH36_1109g00039 [Paralvinella palmiformis]
MLHFCKICSRILSVKLRVNVIAGSKRYKSSNVAGHPQYCCDVVRKGDYENYLTCLLLPNDARTSAFAIRAFNVEVAQIQDIVSEKHIGLMRIQFWREALDKIFQGIPPESPIAMELARAHRKNKLSKQWFVRMLEARNLRRCIKDVHADHVASHVGKAIGVTTLVRAVPHHAQKRQVYLPTDLMIQHEVSQEDIIRGCQDQRVKDLIYDVASIAHQQLKVAREMKSSLPKNTYLALLSTASCELYLKALQRVDFNVFDPRLQGRNNWLPLVIWLQKIRRTY